MSDFTLKTYGELDVIEGLSESSHVIIEENGDIKRYPVTSIGGGASSWNDLEDKPFEATINLVDVVPNQSVEEQGWDAVEHDSDIIVGRIYYVYLNGKEYICTPRLANIMDGNEYILGNPHFYSGYFDGAYVENENTGEPFAFNFSQSYLQWSDDLGETVTFQVAIEQETVKQIDAKFVKGATFTVNVTGTYNEEDGYTQYQADKTAEEICNAYKSGNIAQAVLTNDYEQVILHLAYVDYDGRHLEFVGYKYDSKLTLTVYGYDYGDDWSMGEVAGLCPSFEYIPDATGETVTVEEFNNLLNALRNCQILPWSAE